MERGWPKTYAVTLEEWRVPVGSVVVTPTVVQQTIRRWLQGMNKSPGAVAKALGIGVGALYEWIENSRTIPRSKAIRFCEVARNAKALPDATAPEVEKTKLDARMRSEAGAREAAGVGAKPDKQRRTGAAPELDEETPIKDWPRAIRLFLRLKKETTSQNRLGKLTGVAQSAFSRWQAGDRPGVSPSTVAKLEAACTRHREWKKRKKEAAQAAGTAKAAREGYEREKPSPLSIPQEDAIMQNTTNTDRNDLGAAADAAEIVRLKDENAALKRMVNEQTAEELINLKIIREFARRSLMKKGEQE